MKRFKLILIAMTLAVGAMFLSAATSPFLPPAGFDHVGRTFIVVAGVDTVWFSATAPTQAAGTADTTVNYRAPEKVYKTQWGKSTMTSTTNHNSGLLLFSEVPFIFRAFDPAGKSDARWVRVDTMEIQPSGFAVADGHKAAKFPCIAVINAPIDSMRIATTDTVWISQLYKY